MEKTIKDRWVEALRSGKYTQGEGTLKSNDTPDATFCCLGVLCDIQGADWLNDVKLVADLDKDGTFFTQRETNYLPENFTQPDQSTRELLANSNDGGVNNCIFPGRVSTFSEIADWIQKNLNDDLSRKV